MRTLRLIQVLRVVKTSVKLWQVQSEPNCYTDPKNRAPKTGPQKPGKNLRQINPRKHSF